MRHRPPRLYSSMLAKGDMDGRAMWLRVVRAVEALLDKKPRAPERLH